MTATVATARKAQDRAPRPGAAAGTGGAPARALAAAEIADILNTLGASSLSFGLLGERLGKSRNALYHYGESARALVAAAFTDSCARLQGWLDSAEAGGGDAIARLGRFVVNAVGDTSTAFAALSDVEWLHPPERARIHALEGAVHARLAGLIADGQRDGVLRPGDPILAARLALGVIFWLRTSTPWFEGGQDAARVAAATAEFLLYGLAADAPTEGGPAPGALPSSLALPAGSPNPFDGGDAAAMKVEYLLAGASRLFNRRGIAGTRVADVAAATCVTTGALYHHFADKADLVARCYERAFDLYERFMAVGIASGQDGLGRAATVLRLNLSAQAGGLSPLAPQPGLPLLTRDRQVSFRARADRLRTTAAEQLARGIADGSCRTLDPLVIAEASAGAFLWLPRWWGGGDATEAAALVDAIVDRVVYGLAAPDAPGR